MSKEAKALTDERGKTHGNFAIGSKIVRDLMDVMEKAPNCKRLNPVQKESLHMIAHKQQRILTGDPDTPDHWDDIAGYAHLVNKHKGDFAPAPEAFLKKKGKK